MFKKILGKTKTETENNTKHSEIIEKISGMTISDMRVYVNNKLNSFEICEDGLNEVMRRLISVDSKKQRFIEMDAMDAKKKKAFDLVLTISKSKKVTIVTAELIQEFITLYKDIIEKFDKDHKQIYASRLKDSISNSIATVATMSELNKKSRILS